MGSDFKHVFTPAEIRGVRYKNRLEMAPTSPKFTDPKGFMTTEHIEYFRPIAKGGVGAITLGNCSIDIAHFQDEPRQVALDNDHYIPGLTRDMQEIFKSLPYLVTIVVLVITSLRKKREDQPPASLGLAYFRESRG